METPAPEPPPAPTDAKRKALGLRLRIGGIAVLVVSAAFLFFLSRHPFGGGFDAAFWTLIAALAGLWGVIIAVGLYGFGLWASRNKAPEPGPPPGNG